MAVERILHNGCRRDGLRVTVGVGLKELVRLIASCGIRLLPSSIVKQLACTVTMENG